MVPCSLPNKELVMTNNFQAIGDFLTEQFSSLYDDCSVKDDIFYNVALIGRKKIMHWLMVK